MSWMSTGRRISLYAKPQSKGANVTRNTISRFLTRTQGNEKSWKAASDATSEYVLSTACFLFQPLQSPFYANHSSRLLPENGKTKFLVSINMSLHLINIK